MSPGAEESADRARRDALAARARPDADEAHAGSAQSQSQAQTQSRSPSRDDGDAPELVLHGSYAVRILLVGAGTLALALGIIGIFTPVLPTTPFVLLAAACYARASSRFYRWLTANRTFGPMIREWQRHRSIAYRTKLFAIGSMALTLGLSIAFFVEPLWLKAALAAFGAGLAAWMYRIPSRDAPLRSAARPR